jgi:PAP_fibrillin
MKLNCDLLQFRRPKWSALSWQTWRYYHYRDIALFGLFIGLFIGLMLPHIVLVVHGSPPSLSFLFPWMIIQQDRKRYHNYERNFHPSFPHMNKIHPIAFLYNSQSRKMTSSQTTIIISNDDSLYRNRMFTRTKRKGIIIFPSQEDQRREIINNSPTTMRMIPLRTTKLTLSSYYHTSCVKSSSSSDNDIKTTSDNQTIQSTPSTTTTSDPIINNNSNNGIMECTILDMNVQSKNELYQYAASYDRGYGVTSTRIRQNVLSIIEQLEKNNPAINSADSILQSSSSFVSSTKNYNYSIRSNWRMIWTTAIDVLSLQASPFFTVGAIYQCFLPIQSTTSSNNNMDRNAIISSSSSNVADNLVITNIIDFVPRIQSLIPPDLLPNTLIRVKVKTLACPPPSKSIFSSVRSDNKNNVVNDTSNSNRIGLIFESVAIEPIEILGNMIDIFPPIQFNLPKLPSSFTAATGFFDVTYLDDDLLIIRQNEPGGLFVLSKVSSIHP